MSNTALAEHERARGLEARCEKCFAPLDNGRTTVCRKCGWYAVAGTFVDIDREWEGVPQEGAPQAGGLPRWAWLAIATALAVIVESIIIRCTTAGAVRSMWSGAQFVIGLAAFLSCQLIGFVILRREDSSVAVLDVLLKPVKISTALFRGLPRRFWIVNLGISGLVAFLAAIVIIGSVPYHVLWTWQVGYRSTQALEDAIGMEEGGPPGAGIEAPPKGPARKKLIGVIIGYELSGAGNLRSVLVARVDAGKLRYVGGLAPSGDPAQLFELRENLMAAERAEPIIPMQFDSNWVNPVYSCEISYAAEQDNKKLTDLEWEGDVRRLD